MLVHSLTLLTKTELVVSCIFDYKYDATTSAIYNAALEAAYKEAIPDATGMSDVQKARALHDYLCQHVQYDSSTSYKYTAYGAIVNGLAVCQGYTLAYAALLDKAGISNGLCKSDAMNHIWNYVKIGSYWYHVDVTWDDPTYDRDGYVRHYYFLNSDTKIKTAAPNSSSTHSSWNTNSYSCKSTTYDNAWWSSYECAIFYIDGYEYYLKVLNAGKSSQALALIRRSGSTETQMCSVTTGRWTNYGSTSTAYSTAFSSLSYYDGTLYFNDKTKIYSIYPGQTSKTTIYTYTGTAGYICGSFVCGTKVKICVKKKPYGSEETNLTATKPNNPLSSVSITANPSSLTYGYTKGSTLQASTMNGTSYAGAVTVQWYKLTKDSTGNFIATKISGATSGTYTVPTGLSAGTYYYRVKCTMFGYSKTADCTIVVNKNTGTLTNKNYAITYTYNGSAITAPTASNFTTNAGALTFTWYSDSTKLSSAPTNAGTYTLVIDAAATASVSAAQLKLTITINKKAVTITANNQSVSYGTSITTGTTMITTSGLVSGHTVSSISLTQSTSSVTTSGTITPSNAVIKSGSTVVTSNYNITYKTGTLTITAVGFGQYSLYRIYGANRYETSYKVANALKTQLGVSKFKNIILACGTNYADALAGSYLAAVKTAPILMVNEKGVSTLKSYVSSNLASGGTIYILGGTSAVSANVENTLKTCGTIKRLGGANRYETNLKILNEAGVSKQDILICTGNGFADSLSASALGKPILLVNKQLSSAQKSFLNGLSGNKYYILGGTSAVNTTVENEIRAYGTPTRIGGATRYETSVLIAQKFFGSPKAAVMAYAENFPDGLSGGPLAYSRKAPLILASGQNENQWKKWGAAYNYARSYGITKAAVLGGPDLISNYVAGMTFNQAYIYYWQ